MKHLICVFISICCFVGAPAGHIAAADADHDLRQVDFQIASDPKFENWDAEILVSNEPIKLWLAAIERNDSALQRMAVDTIALAHQRKMPGIESTLPTLIELATAENTAPMVRKSAIRAIIAFDARDQSKLLAQVAAKHAAGIQPIVEQALIKWKSPELLSTWRERINDQQVSLQHRLYAIQGIGALQDSQSSDRLTKVVLDERAPVRIRLEAAKALGKIHESGLTDAAAQLIATDNQDTGNGQVYRPLMSIALLSNHSSEAAIAMLKRLATHKSSVVQSESMARLSQIDSSLLLDLPATLASSPDVNVRRLIAQAWIDAKDPRWTAGLAKLLDDVNPGLRNHVAESLYDLSQLDSLRDSVISEVTGVLDQDAWRGCEQATLVLVNLDQKQIGDRLVDLLRHPRGEVMVTAGWGLRMFGEKKHLPAMLGRGQEIYQGFRSGKLTEDSSGVVDLMAQLFLTFAELEYRECEDLVRKYLPRNFTLGERARGAAALSVGFFYRDQQPQDLVNLLIERLKDIELPQEEYELVREGCARSLGRMNAESALPTLRRFATEYGDHTSRSCHWAIELMTGKEPPPYLPPIEVDYHDWFLSPLKPE